MGNILECVGILPVVVKSLNGDVECLYVRMGNTHEGVEILPVREGNIHGSMEILPVRKGNIHEFAESPTEILPHTG